uniref:Uncharacterized protein n=1 Tax=Cucumis melo TaxID=3656 RepID=A0A9I9D3H3_CUCME
MGTKGKKMKTTIKTQNRSSDMSTPCKTTPKVGLKIREAQNQAQSPNGRQMHI